MCAKRCAAGCIRRVSACSRVRLPERLTPAKLRSNVFEDALDRVRVVLDAKLVRDGEQQRVGCLDRRVPGELLDEHVRLGGVRAPEDRLRLRVQVADLILILASLSEIRAVPIVDQREDAAADRYAWLALMPGR